MTNHAASSPATISVSIIVPVWKGGDGFGECITAAAAAVRPPHEIIVVADGEGDGVWRKAKAMGIRVIELPATGGPARARNAGAKAARSPILFFVDADVVIPSNALEAILDIFAGDPGLAALIGSYDDAPAQANFLSQYKNLFHHYVHQHASPEASTFWGACGAIRREVFLALGGFDENFRQPSIEDIELGYRMRDAGYRIRLVPTLQVKHLKRWEALSLIRTDFLQRAVPWVELFLGRKSVVSDLNLGNAYKASIVISFLFCGTAALAVVRWMNFVAVGTLLACFVAINWPLFQFFCKKRGPRFALGSVCWRFVYDLYSGAGFVYGALRFVLHHNR
jgi:GT2 family glycosyltransferase